MSLVVNHNLMAMNAARNLTTIYGNLSTSVQRLSSGLRVNSAADDAAGLAIRELMRSDIAVLNQGVRNASDAISMIQTAEGAMAVIDEKLIRMKELAEQAATGTYTTAQREIMNSEYQAMAAEIDRIANATDFNGVKLLDGTMASQHNGNGMKIHFGTGNSSAEDYYYVAFGDMRATEATGLRVGNSDSRDIWTTTGLDLGDTEDLIGASDTGVFGIQFMTDGTNWETFGWVSIDSDDTLQSVVDEINSGPAAYETFNIDATATSGGLSGTTLTINGHAFVFATDAGASTANTIRLDGMAQASFATEIARAINDLYGTLNATGALAEVSGSTVTLRYDGFGTPTGSTSLAATNASITWGTGTGSYTVTTVSPLTAAAVIPDADGYELQFSMVETGSSYQIRFITSAGTIINSAASGVTAVAGGTSLFTTAGTVDGWDVTNQASDWDESENGLGNTRWAGADILTQSAAQASLAALDTAINTKDIARANLGAINNRLENTITNLQIQAENLQAAESRISDVDVATEMTAFTSNNIMAQAATAMLAQANSLPQLALQLLGG